MSDTIGERIAREFSADKTHLLPAEQRRLAGMIEEAVNGITSRDYFAAKALQGLCANPAVFASNPNSGWSLVNMSEDVLAKYTYDIASDMMAARKSVLSKLNGEK